MCINEYIKGKADRFFSVQNLSVSEQITFNRITIHDDYSAFGVDKFLVVDGPIEAWIAYVALADHYNILNMIECERNYYFTRHCEPNLSIIKEYNLKENVNYSRCCDIVEKEFSYSYSDLSAINIGIAGYDAEMLRYRNFMHDHMDKEIKNVSREKIIKTINKLERQLHKNLEININRNFINRITKFYIEPNFDENYSSSKILFDTMFINEYYDKNLDCDNLCKNLYWVGNRIIRDICIITKIPLISKLNGTMLHCGTGPALAFGDSTCLYFLNGVQVPKWLVETPANEINPVKFSLIRNVEVRREFVRKVGIEKICNSCESRIIDRRGDYELILINLEGKTGFWPYLKMKNPSIGVYHLEAVEKNIKTVEQAISWRNGTDEKPVQLT